MFAPIPLTSERSPLAHAAEVARRRLAESQALAAGTPRSRTRTNRASAVEKPAVQVAA
jgi:hypothetical protein